MTIMRLSQSICICMMVILLLVIAIVACNAYSLSRKAYPGQLYLQCCTKHNSGIFRAASSGLFSNLKDDDDVLNYSKSKKTEQIDNIVSVKKNSQRKVAGANQSNTRKHLANNGAAKSKIEDVRSSAASVIDALATNVTIVAPETLDCRRIDPEEADFYDVHDENDYLLEDEAREADSVIGARKLISEYYDDVLEDPPLVDVTNITPRFLFSFWALNYFRRDQNVLSNRASLWLDHLQWSRRSQLISLIPKANVMKQNNNMAATALITEEFTVLAADHLSPVAQLVRIEADSLENAVAYLAHDPMTKEDVYRWDSWQLFPAEKIDSLDHDTECSFDADVLSPYVAHVYIDHESKNDSTKLSNGSVKDAIELWAAQSRRFQEEMVDARRAATVLAPQKVGTDRRDMSALASNQSLRLQFYEMCHRLHYFSHIYEHPVPNRKSTSSNSDDEDIPTSYNPVTGSLFLLNAHSQRDAMRFLEQDPLFRTFQISLPSLASLDQVEFTHPQFPELKLLLAPLNVIDVNGLHFLQPTNFASQAALDSLHTMQPTDILLAPVHTFADPSLKLNYELENQWVMEQLQSHQINVSYPWMSNLRELGIVAAYDMRTPPASIIEKSQQPVNAILDVPKGPLSYPSSSDIKSVEKDDAPSKKVQRKGGWIPPLMGRKALKAINRYSAIAARRLLDRSDYYVPIEDGSFSVIPEYLLNQNGRKLKTASRAPEWSQKLPRSPTPVTKEERKKELDESVDFFFGSNEESKI